MAEKVELPNIDRRMRAPALNLLLFLASLAVLVVWYEILKPFLPVISWSLALTVVAYPAYSWLHRKIGNKNIAAAIAVIGIALLVVAPMTFLGHQVGSIAVDNVQTVASFFEESRWRTFLESIPTLAQLDKHFNLRGGSLEIITKIGQTIPQILSSSIYTLVEILLVFFTCFFFFRDHRTVLDAVRELIPLSRSETDELFQQVEDTVYATIYGTLAIACLQGALGGLMFLWLGVPGPILWGASMALLALIPILGAFVIWAPAALFLFISGSWVKALILTIWGLVVIGLIDNILYPFLVGKRLQFHTLAIFFFILGGLFFFGASGLVLGPIALAVGDGLIDIWKRRLRARTVST